MAASVARRLASVAVHDSEGGDAMIIVNDRTRVSSTDG